jgi:uncharacterized protein (TIGR02145 family)
VTVTESCIPAISCVFNSGSFVIKNIVMKNSTIFTARQFFTLTLICILGAFVFLSCEKSVEPLGKNGVQSRKKPKNPPPPPPPPPFYFVNCNTPTYSASLTVGVPANTPIIKNYVNSPGGSYAAFTSATVNGVTISTSAGTFNTGSGSVVFTATGTPINTGFFNVWISVGNIQQCMMFFTVVNQPANPATCGGDPAAAIGSTGCVTFSYRGQTVTYNTVRADDGKIWLQQNLGSPQVAMSVNDESSFGHYFQWGRWDDGHQLANSPTITGGPSLLNPSHISAGNSNFIKGTTASTKWWGSGGLNTNTWNGTTATSTNGKDPCAALGAGWRMPTAADWQNLMSHEDLEGTLAAYQSSLKLPATGFRHTYDGFVFKNGDNGNYWSGTAANNNSARVLVYDDNTYTAAVGTTERGQGFSCRCVKD